MARGFESKAVDSNRQDAEDEREARRHGKRLDVHEIELRQKREGLELSRRRIVTELDAATNERRRESLRAALAHLDGELAKLQ
jgi:ribosomal protein S1